MRLPGRAGRLPLSLSPAGGPLSLLSQSSSLAGNFLSSGCQGRSTFGVRVRSEPEAPFLPQPPASGGSPSTRGWVMVARPTKTPDFLGGGLGWAGTKGEDQETPSSRSAVRAGRCQAGTGSFCSSSRSPPWPVLQSCGLPCDGHAPAHLQPELLFGGLVRSPEWAVGSEGTGSRD